MPHLHKQICQPGAERKAFKKHFCIDCLLVPSLSFCHEKATVALYFGRIRIRTTAEKFPWGAGQLKKQD